MFVLERVAEKDKIIYEKIAGHSWFDGLSEWCVDRKNDIFIVVSGKRGVETPVIFYMYFKKCMIEFWIWESEYNYTVIDVKIPFSLKSDKSEIEDTVQRAYRESNGISCHWNLPLNIDRHIFEFKLRNSST